MIKHSTTASRQNARISFAYPVASWLGAASARFGERPIALGLWIIPPVNIPIAPASTTKFPMCAEVETEEEVPQAVIDYILRRATEPTP